MAMNLFKERIVITIPASEIIPSCRISKIKESDVTGYYTDDHQDKKKKIVDFFDNFNKPFYISCLRVKEYEKCVLKKVYDKYRDKFNNKMESFNTLISLFNTNDVAIPPLFLSENSSRYLKFDNNDKIIKQFKEILYEGITNLVIEKNDEFFYVYPEFRLDYYKIINQDEKSCDSFEDIINDILNNNLFAIHMKYQNSALDVNNPHISIGWSQLGDLSLIEDKEELRSLYKKEFPNDSEKSVGQCVSQIWKFLKQAKIGDYVIYSQYSKIHIGKIVSEYYYDNNIKDQSNDYCNNKKVEWLKTNIPKSILSNSFKNSLNSNLSFFKLKDYKSTIIELISNKYENDDELYENTTYDFHSTMNTGRNLIVYGTPGCGKSYYVQHELLRDYDEDHYVRTTFYQDYTNTDFIGQILPRKNGEDITYDFFPGPFTIALKKAIEFKDEPVALVIEELNRGNAASIFGDIFQLLDRKDGTSEYSILNVNIRDYLNEQFAGLYEFDEIKIPSNMSIFATMNTSDQNVFTLDTAFKRRWDFEKLQNKFTNEHEYQDYLVPGMSEENITWKDLVTSINKFIINNPDLLSSEDKQIGVYFIEKNQLLRKDIDAPSSEKTKSFSYKLLEYLWDDVAKFSHEKWFKDVKTLDQLLENYQKDGKNVFVDGIIKKLNED